MRWKIIRAGRAILFSLLACVIFGGLSLLFQPEWLEWNNYDTIHGFYEQPENTVETVILGASVAVNGFTPMELYENYGICAWNMATEQQPVLASYYWLEEAYRYHPETLKTVVMDVSMLRSIPQESFYQKAIMEMRFSENKLEAIKACTDTFDEFLAYVFPIFSYHTRWKELNSTDFQIFDYSANASVRGYNLVTDKVLDYTAYDEIGIPGYLPDEEAGRQLLKKEALLYLKKIIQFCQEKDLQLILTKTPGSSNWTDIAHNAVQTLAEEYGLTFLDFNYSPYLEEVGYVEAVDSWDKAHMNYYGARKLTDWFGRYLTENCGATDVRGMEKYAFMEEELSEYKRYTVSTRLNGITDPGEYIKAVMEMEDYTLLISVRDDGANRLLQTQRDAFAQLGLNQLAELSYRSAYLGVVENGQVVYEESLPAEETQQSARSTAGMDNDLDTVETDLEKELLKKQMESEESRDEAGPLEYHGRLSDGTPYTLTSGGAATGDLSSCVINDAEYSKNHRGLNFVVYDNRNSRVVDKVYFDTCMYTSRTSKNLQDALEEALDGGVDPESLTGQMRSLYLYLNRAEDSYKMKSLRQRTEDLGGAGMLSCLKETMQEEEYLILLAVQGDAASLLGEEEREQASQLGLEKLSQLSSGASYLAVIDGGNLVTEKTDPEGAAVTEAGSFYQVSSSGTAQGGAASIRVNGVECSYGVRGMNLAVYSRTTKEVIASFAFDTIN